MDASRLDILAGRRLTRRDLLRLGAGVAGASALSAFLAACGTSERGGGGASGGAQTPGAASNAGDILFLSTQFQPIEEAEKMRKTILAGFNGKVTYQPEADAPFTDRIRSEAQAGKTTASLIGALHGGIETFAKADLLEDLTPLLGRLGDRGFPQAFTDLSKFGTNKVFYVPWVQATFIMAANRKALQHLPQGANVDTFTFAQFKQWGANILQ